MLPPELHEAFLSVLRLLDRRRFKPGLLLSLSALAPSLSLGPRPLTLSLPLFDPPGHLWCRGRETLRARGNATFPREGGKPRARGRGKRESVRERGREGGSV